jgi:hypothetical protein
VPFLNTGCGMREIWLIWLTSVLVIVVYCIGASIRTASMINWIQRPLLMHFKNWNSQAPLRKKRARNKDYHRDYYAYSCLSLDELKEHRLLLKLREHEAPFTQTILDLLWKMSLPILVLWIGLTVLWPNSLSSIRNTASAIENLNSIYLHTFHLEWIAAAILLFALIVLLQHLYNRNRKKMIQCHILLIDQVLEDLQSTPAIQSE